MNLDLRVLGRSQPSETVAWSSRDTMLYALAIGAGETDISFTTENSIGVEQQTYPTFASVLSSNVGKSPIDALGDIDVMAVLHGSQEVTLYSALPPAGTAERSTVVTQILDKNTFALVETETTCVLDDRPIFRATSTWVIRGAGGWGGPRGDDVSVDPPTREPDSVQSFQTALHQALLYRLTGDRHPLHSDPEYAVSAGFDRPILHGQCTFGIAGRLLLESRCAGRAGAARFISGRFRRPVVPGERVDVLAWDVASGTAHFVVSVGKRVVIDRGVFVFDFRHGD